MFKKIILAVLLGFVALVIFSYFSLQEEISSPDKFIGENLSAITVGGKQLAVDIADDPSEQSRGLSGRISMPENQGMLFIFEQPQRPGFWMKDMNFSLDLIWIDASGMIIEIAKNVSPETFPDTFTPPSPIKYVLEVNAGWSDRNNIRTGDQIKF